MLVEEHVKLPSKRSIESQLVVSKRIDLDGYRIHSIMIGALSLLYSISMYVR